MERTAFRTCPFCEATCGLELTLRGDAVVKVRGDAEDVFSHGFLCPKGVAIGDLHEDPDRLRTPLVRTAAGELAAASWEQAWDVIGERLGRITERHGRDALGVYIGNPAAHGLAALLYGRVLVKALGTRNVFSASTVDQRPKEISSALMFGTPLSVPVPDVDRTLHLLMLGANPLASNGSLMTAPDMRGRLRALRARGGKLVVVDPRRSRTADAADEHHAIRPGTDAHLLFALVHILFAEGLVAPGRLAELTDGLEEVRALAEPFTPEAVAGHTGLAAAAIRRIARELAAAESAAVYGRVGTTTQAFGTVASWLVDVLNVLTGNLDRPGGAMFPRAAVGQRNSSGRSAGRKLELGRWRSRVRGLPESLGELPAAALAEEIDTPGDGRLRALVTLAGNPARSLPGSGRVERALAQLELLVSLDLYVNETTRHAHVILPAPSPLQHSHYDLALYQLAVRNVAHYSPPVLPPDPAVPPEWETLLRLAAVAAGQGAPDDVAPLDELVAAELAQRSAGRDGAAALLAATAGRDGPERLLDILLRTGPYELTLADLEAAPHGIDLGPLAPRLPEALRTPSGRIELAPAELVADVPRLRAALVAPAAGFVLIGRRQLRSNNSWMHNLPRLISGPERCTLQVHPEDAARLALSDGARARVSGRTGTVEAPVEVTDAIRPGVVSLPHGWGHDASGARLGVAADHAGVNSNVLADEELLDVPSGNAVLNGIPVTLAPAPTVARAGATAGDVTL